MRQLDGLHQALSELALAAKGQLASPSEASLTSTAEPVADAAERYPALLSLLRQQDLAAGPAFAALVPWLHRQGLAADEISQLQEQLDELDFDPVWTRLTAWRSD